MGEVFEKQFECGWGNVDFNGHMANTAFLDFAATTRIFLFAANAFSPEEFVRQQFGPVVKSESIDYFREIKLLQKFKVDLTCSGLSADGSWFRFVNAVYRDDGVLSTRITTTAGWLDFRERRLIAPPEPLLQTISALARTEDFVILESSLKTTR